MAKIWANTLAACFGSLVTANIGPSRLNRPRLLFHLATPRHLAVSFHSLAAILHVDSPIFIP